MTYATTHDTLDDALDHILSDIHGHNIVEPETNDNGDRTGRYVTSTDATASIADHVMWTDDGGLESPGGTDHTPLMEPCEVIDSAKHLRYHFGETIDEFEKGEHQALAFAFVLVDAYPDEDDGETWEDDLCIGYIYELHIYD